MKASELRIGNYVSAPLWRNKGMHIQKVYSLKTIWGKYYMNHDFKESGCEFGAEIETEVEPIQLTEEWFERFMLFKLTIKSDRWYNEDTWVFSFNGKIQCGEFFITTNDFLNFNFYIATIDYGIESWEYITQFKYVHQLQNLYFALTGEELISK